MTNVVRLPQTNIPEVVSTEAAVEMIENNLPVESVITQTLTGRVSSSNPNISSPPSGGSKTEVIDTPDLIPANAPTIDSVSAFRTIYLLCDISGKTKRLRATHYATVLIAGPSPLWGIFSVQTGKLVRFLGSRKQVEEAYPKKAWRTQQAKWTIGGVQKPMDYAERVRHLRGQK